MARLLPAKFSPDWKTVVGVIAAMYVTSVAFAFLPQLSPSAVAGKLTSGNK